MTCAAYLNSSGKVCVCVDVYKYEREVEAKPMCQNVKKLFCIWVKGIWKFSVLLLQFF